MSIFLKWLLLNGVFLFSLPARSQKIFFEQITTAEGAPSDYVNDVYEDSKGYLWIATDKGTCRFDGRKFQYFNRDNGLTDNFVVSISEDDKGNIYFLTYEGGSCIYDGEKISPYTLPKGFKKAEYIKWNKDGSHFISTDNRLYFLKAIGDIPQKILDDRIEYFSDLGTNKYLGRSANNVYLFEKNGSGYKTEKIFTAKNDQKLVGELHREMFMTYNQDSLFIYTVSENKISIRRIIKLAQQPAPGYLVCFYARDNEFWMGSNNLMYTDAQDKTHYYDRENGLGGNLVRKIYEDRRQNLYICTYGGGVKIWPRRYLSEYSVKGKVNSIFPARHDAYITTTNGLYKYSPGRGLAGFMNSTSNDFISLYRANNGNFFLGSYHSFLVVDNDNSLQNLNKPVSKKIQIGSDLSISGFWKPDEEHLFVSTFGGGIRVYNSNYEWISSLTKEKNNVAAGMIEFLVPLKRAVAALTFSAGLTIIDSQATSTHISSSDGLLSNTVFSVFQENEYELWIGTLNGLNLWNGKKIIKTFSFKEGFTGTKVLCIFRDTSNRFWILSDKFLHLLENDKLRLIRSSPVLYDTKNPINRAAYDTASNLLFIGLTDIVMKVQMDRIFGDTTTHIPSLSYVSGDTSLLQPEKKITRITPATKKIVFHFNNSYSPITMRPEIYYKLAGFDEEWHLLDNSGNAVYQKLPVGKYELVAKTINPDGYESSTHSLRQIEILPPIWKQPWFTALTVVLTLGLFFYIGHIISKRRFHQKLQKLQEEFRLQKERERIARELHDNVGSQLTYLINKIDDDHFLLADKTEASKLSSFARGAMQELREAIWALDKKEVHSEELENKLRQLTHLYRNQDRMVELDWQAEHTHAPSFKSLEALNIFRVVQEALNNAGKYSHASRIMVRVENNNQSLKICVHDNGGGFNMAITGKGYGIQNMQKRAEEMGAELTISSAPGKGTLIELKRSQNQPLS